MSALYSCLKGKNDTIMAANAPEGTVCVEAEGTEEGSGKKKSKFQAFKKLFVKKKKKETPALSKESNLKPSQSSSDVSVSGANESVYHPAQESAPKSNLGSKAVSHDSVFVSEIENSTKEDTSQENTPGKVKALQLQLQQNLRIGSPPQGIVHKKLEDSGTLSEDDGLPRSPPEITSLHDILAQSSSKNFSTGKRRNSLSLGGTDSEDEPESGESSSHPVSPRNSVATSQVHQCSLVDFTTPPSSVACLDNSAAKHKIAIKPKKRRGLGMNVNCMKKEGEPLIKEMKRPEKQVVDGPSIEKNEKEVVSLHEESTPPSEESFVEKDESDKAITLIEEGGVSHNPHVEESSDDATMDIGISTTYESSLPDKLILELHTEEDESEVDIHRSSLAMEVPVNGTEETDTKKESGQLISDPMPLYANEEVIEQSDPVELNNTDIETVQLEVSEEIDCDLSDESLKIEESISVFETNDNEDGYQESDEMSPNLTELKDDLVDGSTVGAAETLAITESASAMVKVSDDIINVASKSIKIHDFVDAENVLNKENLPDDSRLQPDVDDEYGVPNTPSSKLRMDNLDHPKPAVPEIPGIPDTPSSNEKVNDLDLHKSCLSNPEPTIPNTPSSNQRYFDILQKSLSNYEPQISNTPSSNKKVENVDLKIESSKNNSVDRGVKISTATIDLVRSRLNSSGGEAQSTEPHSTETTETIKSPQENVDSKSTTSNKPVRFTVAPAWQRSFSVGSGAKEVNFPSEKLRSESFDGSEKPRVEFFQNSSETFEVSKEDSCAAFGVRLRRTSSSRKYNDEYPEEQTKQGLLTVNSAEASSAGDTKIPTKTLLVLSDFTKLSKPSQGEDKLWQKKKSEDPSPQEKSGPAWITMAKQKQKGFQEHPLARITSVTTKSDKFEESDEPTQKKETVSSPQELEVKRIDSTANSPAEDPPQDSGKKSALPANSEEPPWFSLAKKKAKAWSEMPPIAQ